MGFTGCKFKLGVAGAGGRRRARARGRETAGDDFVLTIDANQGYTAAGALDAVPAPRGLNDIRWFEEPCRWPNDRPRAARGARRRGGIPVCAGQSEFSPSGCRDLMETGAIDVCNFDSSWAGGPTNWRRNAGGRARLRRADRPPRGAARRVATCSRASPHGTYLEVLPSRPRPDLVEPDRQPAGARGRAHAAAHRPRPRLGARRGLHRAAPRRPLSGSSGRRGAAARV